MSSFYASRHGVDKLTRVLGNFALESSTDSLTRGRALQASPLSMPEVQDSCPNWNDEQIVIEMDVFTSFIYKYDYKQFNWNLQYLYPFQFQSYWENCFAQEKIKIWSHEQVCQMLKVL